MKAVRGVVGLGMAACIAIACGEDSEGVAVSPEVACESVATGICDKLAECAPFYFTLGVADRATCVARFKINCASSFTASGTSASPARAAQCGNDLKATSCEDALTRNVPEACRTLPGTLVDGAVCGHDAQCAGKLCRRPDGQSCGACTKPGAAGSSCERDEDCDYGTNCVARTCKVKGKAGASCSIPDDCIGTLACSNGVCAVGLLEGVACTPQQNRNDACDRGKGLYCNGRDRVCARVETSPAGGSCELSAERVAACAGGSRCKTGSNPLSGTCEAPAADGAACNDTTGPFCSDPARCVNGLCTITDPAACK